MLSIRSAAIAATLVAFALSAETGQAQTTTTVPLSQATEIALQALRNGRPDIAEQIALALLARDPSDPLGHYLRAFALFAAGHTDPARAAAAEAYRHARTPMQRWQTARFQAAIARSDKRFTTAELWLRRAHDLAPGPAERAATVRAVAQTRAESPLQLTFSSSLTPTSNANGGANTRWSYVTGVEDQWVGQIRYDGRALPGLLGTADVQASYRLHKGARSETRLVASAGVRQAWLSDAARVQWQEDNDFYISMARPDLARPFPETLQALQLELGLRHSFAAAPKRSWGVQASIAQSWQFSGGSSLRLSVGANHRWAFGGADSFTLGATVSAVPGQSQSYSGQAVWAKSFDTLGTLTLGAHVHQVQQGVTTTTWGGSLGFDLARPVGPFSLSMKGGLSNSHTPGVTELFTPVPGGRRVESLNLELAARVDSLSWMGFSPELVLRHDQSVSNVSRFGSEATTVGLRLRSNF